MQQGDHRTIELLRDDLAWHFTRYDSNPELAELEAEARAEKHGLWADPAAINPSDWRVGERGEAKMPELQPTSGF